MTSIRHFLALILCILLVMLPVYSAPQSSSQHAGQVDALIPSATRNDQPVKVKDDLQWNDLLKTARSGRVRASLADGSILSVGSNSELRVVRHDAASQQTSLEMDFGKIRSQVEKITKPGGKFEIKTPNAVIGVVGTDFYAAFSGTKTTVVCYQGRVTVTPVAQAAAVVTLSAGQMVVIDSAIPPGGFHATDVSAKLQQSTMLSTDVPTTMPATVRPGSAGHPGWIFLGSAAAIGIAIGVVATRNSGVNCETNPASGACPR